MIIKNEYNRSTLYTLTRMLFASLGRDHVGSYIVKDICLHNPETRNSWEGITEEACYYMVVVLLQYGLYSLSFVIWNFKPLDITNWIIFIPLLLVSLWKLFIAIGGFVYAFFTNFCIKFPKIYFNVQRSCLIYVLL